MKSVTWNDRIVAALTCSRPRLPLVVGLGLWLGGCSLSLPNQQPCEADEECRAAFGFGHQCNARGFCAEARIEERCTTTFPDNLFDGDLETTRIVYGSMFQHNIEAQRGRVKAMNIALRNANDQNGFEGGRFGAVHCDVSDADTAPKRYADGLAQEHAAPAVARYLLDELGVPAIVGPPASNDLVRTFTDVVEGSDTLIISPAGTTSAVEGLEIGPFTDQQPGMLWRTSASDTVFGEAMAEDMLRRGIDDVVIIGVLGYGQTLGRTIQDTFDAHGAELPVLVTYQEGNSSDQNATIISAGQNHPDADEFVFITSDTLEMVDFMAVAATSKHYQGKSVFLTVAAANGAFLQETVKREADQLFGPTLEDGDPKGLPDFQFRTVRFSPPVGPRYNNFVSVFDGDDNPPWEAEAQSFTAHTYDATWMVMYGTLWSWRLEERVTGKGIARGFRRLVSGDALDVGYDTWSQIRAALQSGTSVNIEGASGDLDYDLATEELEGRADILVVVEDPEGLGWMFEVESSFP